MATQAPDTNIGKAQPRGARHHNGGGLRLRDGISANCGLLIGLHYPQHRMATHFGSVQQVSHVDKIDTRLPLFLSPRPAPIDGL